MPKQRPTTVCDALLAVADATTQLAFDISKGTVSDRTARERAARLRRALHHIEVGIGLPPDERPSDRT